MRPVTYIGLLVAVLVGSFRMTLWQIDTKPSSPGATDGRSDSDRLAGLQLSNYGDLTRLTDALGLKRSSQMKGNIDAISRTNDREVMISGWLADPEGDATPLSVVVFVSGSIAATTQTKGERPDVTHLLGLSFGSEKNVRFRSPFQLFERQSAGCRRIRKNKIYLPLISPSCP